MKNLVMRVPVEPGSTHAELSLQAEPYSRELTVFLDDQTLAIVRSVDLLKCAKAIVSYQERVAQEEGPGT